MRRSILAAAATLAPAILVAAAPTQPAVPSYGVGTFTLQTTVGPGGVPAGNGQPAISSTQVVNAGVITTTQLANGDIEVSIVQGFNDNTYGANADPLWGKKGHTFNDLLGSDKAGFKFTNGAGQVVLDFDVDYIGQAKTSPVTIAPGLSVTYPSGYGTLGVLGGDGKLILGDGSNIKFIDTTLTDNLNNPEFNPKTHPDVLVNSPTSPDWNKQDGFTVIVSKNAFGASGFGGVQILDVHDSPARPFSPVTVPLPATVYGVGALLGGLFLAKRRKPVTA